MRFRTRDGSPASCKGTDLNWCVHAGGEPPQTEYTQVKPLADTLTESFKTLKHNDNHTKSYLIYQNLRFQFVV